MNQLVLKKMGVINLTPNSFSGLGEVLTPEEVLHRLNDFGELDALDIGAESTAPMNSAISADEEWQRILPHLPLLKSLKITLSVDTYHPETILKLAKMWRDEKVTTPLVWNDVSGKFDEWVEEFLSCCPLGHYVFCHNLAPARELSGKHMDYLSPREGEEFLEELVTYFEPYCFPRIILDPTLGFSKTMEQNWFILEHFGELQRRLAHDHWLLGFSRKSFLRKRLGIEKMTAENREELDLYHQKILEELRFGFRGIVWVRTHRPELIL